MAIAFLIILTVSTGFWLVAKTTGTRPPRRSLLAGATLAALILTWLANEGESWSGGLSITGQQGDYYNLLVDGFMSGHTYLPVEPSAERTDPDPLVRRNAPYLLDAALYQGRYYLYYGVAPAALVMWPYSALTGHDLSPNTVTLLCTLVGLGFASATLARAERRYFPGISGGSLFLLTLLLGLGSGTGYLVLRSMFYELPAAGGYACTMAASLALWQALHSDKRTLALAAGSLALGLAVGCRPNYVFALPVLLLPVFLSTPSERTPAARLRLRWLLAAVLPAAGIGLGLALYNFARFGSPLEFGFSHGLNPFFDSKQSVLTTQYLWDNFRFYYLSPPQLSAYFPFFHPIAANYETYGMVGEAMHGQFYVMIFACCSALVLLANRARLPARMMMIWVGSLAIMALPSLLFMCLLKIRADRYAVDFHAPLLLGLCMLTAAALAKLATTVWRKPLTAMLAVTGLCAVLANSLGPLEQFDKFASTDPRTHAALTRATYWLSDLAHQAGLVRYGPVTAALTFHSSPPDVRTEEIFSAGLTGKMDSLFVRRYPDGTAEFLVTHQGYGAVSSPRIAIRPGHAYELTINWGALYPPSEHPYFKHHTPEAIDMARTTVEVTLDNQPLIQTYQRFFDAPPWTVGPRRDLAATFLLTQIDRPGTVPPKSIPPGRLPTGYWCFDMEFDHDAPSVSQPLLASGVSGKGNLLFVELMQDGQIRFGCDFWGYYAVRSPKFSFDLQQPHRVEIFNGYLARFYRWPASAGIAEEALQANSRTLRVWVDGQPVWAIPLTHHAESYGITHVGSNAAGFNTAINVYSAPLEVVHPDESELVAFIARNLALPPAGETGE